jgi:hypothetical protein
MAKKLKFKVGETVWQLSDRFRKASRWTQYQIVGIEDRSYVVKIGVSGYQHNGGKWSFAKAEGCMLTDTEKAEAEYDFDNRSEISRRVDERSVDVPTLRKIAELIGYEAK